MLGGGFLSVWRMSVWPKSSVHTRNLSTPIGFSVTISQPQSIAHIERSPMSSIWSHRSEWATLTTPTRTTPNSRTKRFLIDSSKARPKLFGFLRRRKRTTLLHCWTFIGNSQSSRDENSIFPGNPTLESISRCWPKKSSTAATLFLAISRSVCPVLVSPN